MEENDGGGWRNGEKAGLIFLQTWVDFDTLYGHRKRR